MKKRIERPGVCAGYDRWSKTYDNTPNPLVALDRRHTMRSLSPQRGEYVLDVACGTGQHLKSISQRGSRAVGLDFSRAMLSVARRQCPHAPLIYADLETEWPFPHEDFDAILCSLVGEHINNLAVFFQQACAALKPGGRFVFSVFHPELVAAGIESNFAESGVEYRLGAIPHTTADYLEKMDAAGFRRHRFTEFVGDEELVHEVPQAKKYLNRPLLLVIEAQREMS